MRKQAEALTGIGFRNAQPADLPDIMRIEHASFSPLICESEAVYAERIRVFPEGFRVITHDQNVIGFLSTELWLYQEVRTEEDFKLGHAIAEAHSPRGTELYISSMGLDPRYRGLGLGQRLFHETVQSMRKQFPQIQSAVLIVSEAWSSARRIYQQEGFVEIQRIKGFFACPTPPYGEDGIVMRKRYRVQG
jgi:ribosomal-protein-alanine N-acetyltransferase